MTEVISDAIRASRVLDAVLRNDRTRLIAALATSLRDLTLAEDALQEASLSALATWGKTGIPSSPQGWLLTVARRKAIDRLRGVERDSRKTEMLTRLSVEVDGDDEKDEIPDHRLRLIFTCCHPALEMKSRVALTLRTVCGLSTREIARCFLDAEPTMGQRLSRAKSKITSAGIPFAVPGAEDWSERLDAVLTTAYLIFTTGYVAGADEPRDLCAEAEYLMRLMDRLRPEDPEIEGALAMMLIIGARRNARVGSDGATVPPAEQDRSLWQWPRLEEGRQLLDRAMHRRHPGPFQIKAAIAECHTHNPGPDWPQIAALYGALWRFEPTPVVALNAAVARAESGYPEDALRMVEQLRDSLADFQPWHAAYAALLQRVGRFAEAAQAYQRAIADAPSAADAAFLTKKLSELVTIEEAPRTLAESTTA